ncbi:MAG: phosphohydrolase [Thermoplasmata archaeon]|nr:MAG: phosphohydrolase [Thermoplasmata archaeon]
MLTREEAFTLIKKYLKDDENIKYALAVEAILREMARRLGKNEELWGLTGLLHNLDYEFTSGDPQNRGTLAAQILEGLLPEDSINAIKANNYLYSDYIPVTSLDKALIATVSLTGLIFATARSIPSKKLSDVDINVLYAKFNDPGFAPNCNRSRIKLCVDTGIEVETFLALSLKTLQGIADEIGL